MLAAIAFLVLSGVQAQGVEQIRTLAVKEKQPLLETLKALVSIESGSRDREGLDKVAALVAARLQALGSKVEQIEPGADVYKMHDTPEKIGKDLVVDDRAEGGGTDAAFAALKAKGPVIERFGLRGFGAHSADAEYVLIESIEPRLYLAARMIMDVALDKAPR